MIKWLDSWQTWQASANSYERNGIDGVFEPDGAAQGRGYISDYDCDKAYEENGHAECGPAPHVIWGETRHKQFELNALDINNTCIHTLSQNTGSHFEKQYELCT